MRSAVALVVAIGIATALVVAARRGDPSPQKAGTVALLGDSLNVGVEPYLGDELPRWTITSDDVVGRSTDAGIAALEGRVAELPPVLVVSLGTNDDQGDAATFGERVARILELTGPERCVVWPTIWRGGPSDELNAVLRRRAAANRTLVLVEWAGMVDDDPSLLAEDGMHAAPEGYARRAVALADAVRHCPSRTDGAA